MSTAHPLLAQWLREAGAPARSASGWQATQNRLDGLAQGLDGVGLFNNPWQALDQLPWAGSATPSTPSSPSSPVAPSWPSSRTAVVPAAAAAAAQVAAQAHTQARLQAVLQVLTPLTAARGGAVAMAQPGSVAAAAAPARPWAPLAASGARGVATGTAQPYGPGEVRGLGQAAVQGAAQGRAPSGGHRVARGGTAAASDARRAGQPPPAQPAGPAFSPISAAAAAAQWLERSTRAGLDAAFQSPLGLRVQLGLATHQAQKAEQALRALQARQAPIGPWGNGSTGATPAPSGAMAWLPPFTHVPTTADLAEMARNLPRQSAAGRASAAPASEGSGDGGWMAQVLRPFGVLPSARNGVDSGVSNGVSNGGGLADVIRGMAEQANAAEWVGEDPSAGVNAYLKRRAEADARARKVADGVRARDAARQKAQAGADQAWRESVAGTAHGALGAVAEGLDRVGQMSGMTGLSGLRGLAQRAMQAKGLADPGDAAQATGRAAVAAAGRLGAAPARPATSPTATPAHRPAGFSARGGGGEAAPCAAPDDQQLLQQLARVLRREAERDGINLSDTAP